MRTILSSTGKTLLCVQDLFLAFGDELVKAEQRFGDAMRNSPYDTGGSLAGLLVCAQQVTGNGPHLLFAPVEVALDIMESWVADSEVGLEGELYDSVGMLLGDLRALIPKVS